MEGTAAKVLLVGGRESEETDVPGEGPRDVDICARVPSRCIFVVVVNGEVAQMEVFFKRRPLVHHARRLYRSFSVLAIETSADDTGVAIVSHDRRIQANVVIKQHSIHEQHGGIHPLYAARAHQQNLPGAVRSALSQAGMTVVDIDGIAFTRGPGMPGALTIGASAAKTLAAALDKPLVGVNHMQAHALTALLTSPVGSLPTFPFLTLLVSGGHTLLLLATSKTDFRILATTLDESIGRAYDKVSRMLALKWSTLGPGAALEDFCSPMPNAKTDTSIPRFSVGMLNQQNFSYTGLHSAVERVVTAAGGTQSINEFTRRDIAREFQRAAVGQLAHKMKVGIRWCRKNGHEIRHVVVSGGVASNTYLREQLSEAATQESPHVPISLVFPPATLCTDNGVMIAWASMHRFLATDYDDYTIGIKPNWSIEDLTTS